MNKLPADINDLLLRLENPEDVKRIQSQWEEYSKANEAYERNYPQQFGNLVEANLKFRENKTIPTPAEQMEQYNDTIRGELHNLLDEKQPDEVYYEEPDTTTPLEAPAAKDKFKDFKLTFDDIGPSEKLVEPSKTQLLDKQELNIPWVQNYFADKENTPKEEAAKENNVLDNLQDNASITHDFQLTFDTLDREHKEDEKEHEKEGLDVEYE